MLKSARALMLITSAALAGCAVTPQNFSTQEISQINEQDRHQAMAQVTPFGEKLTLDEAIARALKYNLDQRVKMLEKSLASGELEAGKFDMLPKLLAGAGYDWRNNFSHRFEAPYSDPTDIRRSPFPDVSVDPEHGSADLRLSWNILDFGASYYSAKQQADRLLIANEKRRKAMHLLIQKVRSAYWRALAAETLSERVRFSIADAERALNESEKLAAERVRKPEESLRYQRNLLENLRLLESVERELASSRIELSNLIGALPGTSFKLSEPTADLQPLTVAMEALEAKALISNADLREQFFNARIAAQDTRKALLKLLPGITMDYGTYYDNDRYLVNEDWNAASLKVSFNLFNLLSGPSRMSAAEKNEELAKARRMALQMTVVTQVHLAAHRYTDAMRQFKRADKIHKVDAELGKIISAKYAGDIVSEQAHISANVTTILSELRRYQAMAKFQEAQGELQATLGLEPEINSLDDIPLQNLTDEIATWMEKGLTANAIAM